MTPAAAAAPPRGAAEGQEALRRRVARYLGELTGEPAEVHAAISRLRREGLVPFGYQPCHLGLASLFGEAWPAGRVRRAAEQCARNRLWRGWQHNMRYHAANLRRIGVAGPGGGSIDGGSSDGGSAGGGSSDVGSVDGGGPVLAGWEAAPLAELRAGGRGVLVCGFHFGSYRFVPTDLCHLGLPVTFAVDTRTVEGNRRGGSEVPGFAGLRVARIDDPAGLVAVVRGLRGGGAAYLNVDGNRGWGAGQGGQSHCAVRFLGLELKVMTGAARLAAANGAAILPVAALPDGPAPGRVACGAPILPPAPGEDAGEHVRRTMQALYDFFAAHVAADPAEWQDVRFLHRWRDTPRTPSTDAPDPAAVERRLAAGAAFRLDGRRCVRLDGEGGAALVDARSLRAFPVPAALAGLLAALEGRRGAGAASLAALSADEREAALDLLARLLAHGLLRGRG